MYKKYYLIKYGVKQMENIELNKKITKITF